MILRYVLPRLLLFLAACSHSTSAEPTEPKWSSIVFTDVRGGEPRTSTVKMAIRKYDPPIHFEYGELVTKNGPDWVTAFTARRRLDLFDYKSWIRNYSPEFVAKYGLNAKMFEARRLTLNRNSAAPLTSAVWDIYFKNGERWFCFAASFDSAHLERLPANPRELGKGLTVYCYERLSERWMHQLESEVQGFDVLSFPFDDIAAIERIVRTGRAWIIKGQRTTADEPSTNKK